MIVRGKDSKALEEVYTREVYTGSQFPGVETGPRGSLPEGERQSLKEQDRDDFSASSSDKRIQEIKLISKQLDRE